MKPLTAKQIMNILERNDFEVSRQKGSHLIYKHIHKGIIVSVPRHGGNKSIPIGTFLAIVKQSELDNEEFQKSVEIYKQ